MPSYRRLLQEHGLRPQQVCYIGDDLPDLPLLLHCGLAVLTTNGPHASSALAEVVRFCSTPKDAFTVVESLIADHAEINRLSSKSLDYAVQFSWEDIAKRHALIYEAVLRQR